MCDSLREGWNNLATCIKYERLVLLTSVCDSFERRTEMECPLLTPEEEARVCGPWMRYPSD